MYTYLDSSFTSKYYEWMCELGYPQLDIQVADDGEWWIIQYINAPVIPSMTKTQVVIHGFKHVTLCKGFVERVVKSIDPQRQEFWEMQEAKTRKVEEEALAKEKHQEESAEKKMEVIRRTPELWERVATKGTEQILPHKMLSQLSPSERRRLGYVNRQFFTAR